MQKANVSCIHDLSALRVLASAAVVGVFNLSFFLTRRLVDVILPICMDLLQVVGNI